MSNYPIDKFEEWYGMNFEEDDLMNEMISKAIKERCKMAWNGGVLQERVRNIPLKEKADVSSITEEG